MRISEGIIKYFSIGAGSSGYTEPLSSSGGGITSGNNGLSVSKVSPATLVWGQDVGDILHPADLLNDRQIDFKGFSMDFTNAQLLFSTPQSPAIISGMVGPPVTKEWFRYNFIAAPPAMPYQHVFASTDNGGGVSFDLQSFTGFNVDKQFSGAHPSWSTRMEYAFLDTLYEYHLQFQDVPGNVFRLMSFTFTDHANPNTDLCTIFFSSTDFELRPVNSLQAYWTAGIDQVTDEATMTLRDAAGAVIINLATHKSSNDVELNQSGSLTPLSFIFAGFAEIDFFAGGASAPKVSVGGVFQNMFGFFDSFKVARKAATVGMTYLDNDFVTPVASLIWDSAGPTRLLALLPGNGVPLILGANNTGILQLNSGVGGNLDAFFAGAVQTANPLSGVGLVKLGSVVAGAVVLDAGNYWEVSINGTIKKILLST
jgi:hypothetical protein